MKAMVPKGPSMNEMLRQAQKMQEEMQAKQAELEEKEYDVSAGGGVIKIKINGRREILAVDLAPEIVDPDDIEMLEDLITEAMMSATNKATSQMESKMKSITGGISIPGLF